MELRFKKAGIEDLDVLVRIRIEFLRAVNEFDESVDMTDLVDKSYEYYKGALESGEYVAYLVFDKNKAVGVGGINFLKLLPTYNNPTGYKAYISNIYTNANYRRMGIAYKVVDLLVTEAKEKGISKIELKATKMGRKVYEKYGFTDMKDEMTLISKK